MKNSVWKMKFSADAVFTNRNVRTWISWRNWNSNAVWNVPAKVNVQKLLPSSAVIRNNDQVVTSGSTVYPKGLILGNVVDAGFEETGVAKFAILDPAADISSMEQVFIVTQYTTE